MQTYPNGTEIAAPIICQTAGCTREGEEINRVTMDARKEDAFYEDFGHGGETWEDHCPVCCNLGLLLDPEPLQPAK